MEEGSPFLVKQSTIGLEVVFDALIRLLVFLFELNDLFEELQSEKGRLAALPGKHDLCAVLSFNILFDVFFQNLVSDMELAGTSEQIFLVQVVAVGAIEIADCPKRLDHRVIGRRRTRFCREWRAIRDLDQIIQIGG